MSAGRRRRGHTMNALLNSMNLELIQRLGWTLLHFLWQGTLVAAVAWTMLRATHQRSASFRYNILLALFLILVACPIATFPLLSVETPEFSSHEPFATSSEAASFAEAPAGQPGTEYDSNELGFGTPNSDPAPAFFDSGDSATVNRDSATEPSVETAAVAQAFDNGPPNLPWTRRVELALPWLVSLWCLGVIIFTVRLAGACWRVRSLRRTGVSPLIEPWVSLAESLTERIRCRRLLQFLESGLVHVPMVVGWLKPVVLVPTSLLTNLTPQEIEALFAHELAHIRRRDEFVNLLQAIVETLLFYHPATWWLSARFRSERENCCDDIAVAIIGNRVTYSRALVGGRERWRTGEPRPASAGENDAGKRRPGTHGTAGSSLVRSDSRIGGTVSLWPRFRNKCRSGF